MVSSAATTVKQYLAELPTERRDAITKMYTLVRKHLPKGYEEGMQYGMIGWYIPLERYPDTYNKQPLGYVALAAQKNYNTVYLMSAYAKSAAEKSLRAGYKAGGKKLDMGKCCVRFRQFDDVVPEALGAAIAALSPEEFIEVYETSRQSR